MWGGRGWKKPAASQLWKNQNWVSVLRCNFPYGNRWDDVSKCAQRLADIVAVDRRTRHEDVQPLPPLNRPQPPRSASSAVTWDGCAEDQLLLLMSRLLASQLSYRSLRRAPQFHSVIVAIIISSIIIIILDAGLSFSMSVNRIRAPSCNGNECCF